MKHNHILFFVLIDIIVAGIVVLLTYRITDRCEQEEEDEDE